MAGQQAQVFLRSTDMGAKNPMIVATYPSTRPVDPNAHGTGMSIVTLPTEAVRFPNPADGSPPSLVDNWQSFLPGAVSAAATQRIEAVFPTSEQISSLRKMLDFALKYGVEATWPVDAKKFKAELDEKWRYIDAVLERAEQNALHAAATNLDPSSDKNWPQPPAKTND